jgi:hypothetical protein
MISIIILAISGFSLEMPQKDLSVADMADPKQDKAERKIWINILQTYGQWRKTARTLLEDINSVCDLAWATQRQLNAIETVAGRIQSIAENIDKYKFTNLIQLVKDIEEGVFQQTDLILFNDIPDISDKYKELIIARNEVLNRGSERIDRILQTSNKIYNATEKQFKKIFKKSEYEGETVANVYNNKLTSEIIASQTAKSINLDNQSVALTQQMKKLTDSSGALAPEQLASYHINENRNRLLLDYQWHEYQNEQIRLLSMVLLAKSKRFFALEKNKEKIFLSCNQ